MTRPVNHPANPATTTQQPPIVCVGSLDPVAIAHKVYRIVQAGRGADMRHALDRDVGYLPYHLTLAQRLAIDNLARTIPACLVPDETERYAAARQAVIMSDQDSHAAITLDRINHMVGELDREQRQGVRR